MSFRDFTFPRVVTDLGLKFREDHLFSDIPPVQLSPDLTRRLDMGREVSQGINNEKARSEFLIAPLLLEIWIASGQRFGLFSGTELNVEPAKGLNGVCDFLIAREPLLSVLNGPIMAVVEAKNDNVWNGYAQCIATTHAAALHNQQTSGVVGPMYGASTTGVAWKFIRVDGATITLDRSDYFFNDLGAVAAILFHIAGVVPSPWPVAPHAGKVSQ